MCIYHCAQLSYRIQHRTVRIIFPLITQTITTAQMMSTGAEEECAMWTRVSRSPGFLFPVHLLRQRTIGDEWCRNFYRPDDQHNRVKQLRGKSAIVGPSLHSRMKGHCSLYADSPMPVSCPLYSQQEACICNTYTCTIQIPLFYSTLMALW